MRRMLFLTLTLAACATSTMPPCACVEIPDPNGLTSVMVDGVPQILEYPDESNASVTSIAAQLYLAGEGRVRNSIDISDFGNLSVEAEWAEGTGADLSATAVLTRLDFDTMIRADTDYEDNLSYELGPGGGTLTLREIVAAAEGGLRLRGGFRGQICPEGGVSGGCRVLSGDFAFDHPGLPEGVVTGGLRVGG